MSVSILPMYPNNWALTIVMNV